MVGENAIINFSEIISAMPPHIIKSIGDLVLILKAAGIAMIVYIFYVITMGVVSIRRSRRIKTIEDKVISIDKKLNKLIKARSK